MTAECDIHLTSGDWVDLGLPSGLLWATRNVGASSPTDYGNYYAWGETAPKSVYDWSTYLYASHNSYEMTRYTGRDGLTTLRPDGDAATTNYGGRTPTKEEWQELIDNTTSRWVDINGVRGRYFTGANGNSIFIPASGCRCSSLQNRGISGYYWSSSLFQSSPRDAWSCYFDSDRLYWEHYEWRMGGFCVRAVR
jgi:hypothetical protein